MENQSTTPMLFPYEPDRFWQMMQQLIRQEVERAIASVPNVKPSSANETLGLTYKPLYKVQELCALFKVTKPTIYDWIKHGKLKPHNQVEGLLFMG